MSATLDVDIGGTFTDCYVALEDGRSTAVKTPTTGFRLSVGFMRGVQQAADELGLSVDELLGRVSTVRYSTTVAMNTLLQRTGPRLALITTEGHEDVLRIAKGAAWMDASTLHEIRNIARITKPVPLVTFENTFGAKERIDATGRIVRPLDEEHFVTGLRRLVDNGVRGFVVALLFSYLNPEHELRIRSLIEAEFPESYLGAMPVMLSSEVAPKRWEYTRTNTTLLNTYLHQAMWEELAGMNDDLREHGYRRGIMMVHNTGGMAEVYRTSAVETYNGGPVAGLIGGAAVGRKLGYENVIVTDMGGTSFDVGLVVDGATSTYDFRPIIDRYWVDMSILETKSIGAGGGSIAWVNEAVGNRLEVGPRGAGSMPGPACYGQGGREPTVTDADLVLGYLDPAEYFGGKLAIDRGLAEAAISEFVARPLGIDVVEAAKRIKRTVDANMADVIARETHLRGYDPKQFVLAAFGGAGPTHCCGYGGRLQVAQMLILPFSPVFCAWGSSTMPVAHIYEVSRRLELLAANTQAPTSDYATFNESVAGLREEARRDLQGEGYDVNDVQFTLELDMKYGGQIHIHRAISPVLSLGSPEDVLAIVEDFGRQYAEAFSPMNVFPAGGVEIHNFVLRAELPPHPWSLPAHDDVGPDPTLALIGEREAQWMDGPSITPVYRETLLGAGNVIAGPAIVEAEYTTVVVEPGFTLRVDPHLNLIISSNQEGNR